MTVYNKYRQEIQEEIDELEVATNSQKDKSILTKEEEISLRIYSEKLKKIIKLMKHTKKKRIHRKHKKKYDTLMEKIFELAEHVIDRNVYESMPSFINEFHLHDTSEQKWNEYTTSFSNLKSAEQDILNPIWK